MLTKLTLKRSPALSTFRNLPEFDDHELVIALTDKASGLKAYIAVHNSNLGMTHGGTRVQVYKNDEAALRDALNLSRAMSYKSALAKLPFGGAKGVIIFRKGPAKQRANLQGLCKRSTTIKRSISYRN